MKRPSATIIPFPRNRIVRQGEPEPSAYEVLEAFVDNMDSGKVVEPDQMLCLCVLPPGEDGGRPVAFLHAGLTLLEARGLLATALKSMEELP